MSTEEIALMSLIWKIISSFAVGCWVVVPVLIKYVKPRWQQWHYTKLVPSRRAARKLRRLTNVLGQIRFWLSYSENEMMRSIGRELFKVKRKITTESSAYLAVYSKNERERWSALLFLAQVDDAFIEYAMDIVNGVIQHRGNSDKIRDVAKMVMAELETRQEIKGQTLKGQ